LLLDSLGFMHKIGHGFTKYLLAEAV